jgi:hypothetical protein
MMTDDIVIAPDEPSVCIEDFCGGGRFPTSFSADYYPRLKLTRFSGDWSSVIDMPSETAPTEIEVHEWANNRLNWLPEIEGA